MSDEFPAITELVPHQTPVLALDEVTSWEPGHAVGKLTIRDDNLFVQDGTLDTVMALEYMAQCVAACLGMEVYRGSGNIRVGMIIACRKMQILNPHLLLNETYTVKVNCVRGSESASHYTGEIKASSGELIADASMTLVHGEKPPE